MSGAEKRGLRVTLCQINSQYIHSALAPWSLAAAVQDRSALPHTLRVEDANINQPPEEVARRLCTGAPDLIGLCCYIWNAAYLRRLLPLLRTMLPKAILVAGGPQASFDCADFWAKHPQFDYLLAGEGEVSFPMLLDALADAKDPSGVPGLVCKTDVGLVQNPPPAPVSELSDPYTPAYFEALQGRIAYLEGSRGCPFHCAFCLSGREDRLRQFPLLQTLDRALRLAKSGCRTIKFVDRTFNADLRRAKEIWRFLICRSKDGEIPEGVCFHFEVGADLFDAESIALLAGAPAGLFQFEAGLQSFSPKTLETVARTADNDRICANLLALREPGNIHLHIDLIAGLPYEDAATFAAGFDRAFALGPHQLQLGFLKLLQGSPLWNQAAALGLQFDPEPPYAVTSTRWLSTADLARLRDAEWALDRLHNSGRYPRTLTELLDRWQGGALAFFAAFAGFCRAMGLTDHPPQDQIAEQLFSFGRALAGMSELRLRDLLCMDLLACRRGGKLPAFLRREDPDFGRIAPLLRAGRADGVYPELAGARERFSRGLLRFCILYSGVGCCGGGHTLVFADHRRADPVSGQYPLISLPLEEFFLRCEEPKYFFCPADNRTPPRAPAPPRPVRTGPAARRRPARPTTDRESARRRTADSH